MIKKILLWTWGIALTLTLVGVLINLSSGTFGDSATVVNFPQWFTGGIAIGQPSGNFPDPKLPVKIRAIISSSTVINNTGLLGAFGSTTSTTSTTMTIPYDGYDNVSNSGAIATGAPCILGISNVVNVIPLDGQVTSISSTAQTVTVQVEFQNYGTTATTTTNGTSTLQATCFNVYH